MSVKLLSRCEAKEGRVNYRPTDMTAYEVFDWGMLENVLDHNPGDEQGSYSKYATNMVAEPVFGEGINDYVELCMMENEDGVGDEFDRLATPVRTGAEASGTLPAAPVFPMESPTTGYPSQLQGNAKGKGPFGKSQSPARPGQGEQEIARTF